MPSFSDVGHARRDRWRVALALAAITAVAAFLRFWGLRFGLPSTMARPDEETITATAAQIVLHGPDPKFFGYPTLFMYAVALVERVWPGGPPVFDDVAPTLIARTISASLGTLSIPLLFVAARAMFSSRIALTAAALLAVAFLHVRDSHFGVTDVSMTFMLVLAFTATVVLQLDSARWWNVAVAGLLCGLATSTKYNALIVVAPVMVVLAQARSGAWVYALAGAFVVAGFVAGTPYALVAPSRFFAAFASEQAHLAAGHGSDEGLGWAHHMTFSLRYGLGSIFLLTAVAGAVWLVRSDLKRASIVLAFPVLYYIGIGSGRTAFMRYMIPMTPFMALLAAIAIGAGSDFVGRRVRAGWLPAVLTVVLTIIVGFDGGLRAIGLDSLLTRRDSRAIAADVVHDRYFPRGASLYQNGTIYGRVKPWPEGLYPELPLDRSPELAIVHTSRLLAYSSEPEGMRDLLAKRYRLLRRIDVERPSSTVTPVFDQQDAFFAPVAGFDRFDRPGPTIEIYERADR